MNEEDEEKKNTKPEILYRFQFIQQVALVIRYLRGFLIQYNFNFYREDSENLKDSTDLWLKRVIHLQRFIRPARLAWLKRLIEPKTHTI